MADTRRAVVSPDGAALVDPDNSRIVPGTSPPGRFLLGPADLFGARAMTPVVVDGHHLLIIPYEGRLVAAERACPHEGADLALGRCLGTRLMCPRHRVSFDLASGSVSPGWSIRALRLFPLEIKPDGLWITIEQTVQNDRGQT